MCHTRQSAYVTFNVRSNECHQDESTPRSGRGWGYYVGSSWSLESGNSALFPSVEEHAGLIILGDVQIRASRDSFLNPFLIDHCIHHQYWDERSTAR